ncbi:DNA repair photolyase [Paenibacillus castaneae]|uniref:SPL family radical SAM protein n=1 Tax=Paenibacillus castaneae TaxID=474957 RepID=UPI000C9B8C01|nr:radical SAM protein [Paenibacillus castaneae]NIK78881.1 DNA repair photolyase [Paenibacillus castaneae]
MRTEPLLEVNTTFPNKILTATGGFLNGYSHSLNPYVGCSFACSYCYVRRSPVGLFRKQEWGTWVDIKQEVDSKIAKEIRLARKKGPVTIFMSSSTDPYQPVEFKQKVTRALLEQMALEQPDFLFVQTRSPLVTRDIDLFKAFAKNIMVSVTVETDLDAVRRVFSPSAPPIQARLKAIKELRDEGIPVQAAVAPVLPFSEAFPRTLSQLVERVCIDDYYSGDGSGGKRTEKLRIGELYSEADRAHWFSKDTHLHVKAAFLREFRQEHIHLSQSGFLPPQ